MPTNSTLLAEVPFFQLMDDQEREELARRLDEVKYAAGHVIFKQGDPGDSMYVIRSGTAEVFFKDDTGSRIVLDTPSAGDFIGELSLLDGGPRTASVQVTEDMEALRVDRGDLDEFFRVKPHAALDFLTVVGKRLRVTNERLRHTASRNVNEEVEDKRTRIEKAADWIAWFSGSIAFLMIHVVLFAIWIGLNLEFVHNIGFMASFTGFDPFPYGLLTMCVSLEAIFLSVFVLLSQNRQAAKDRVRADIEYDVNLKAELEVAHLHEKLDHHAAETAARLARIEQALSSGKVA